MAVFLFAAGALSGGMSAPSGEAYPFPAPPACQPHLEYDHQIRVDVAPNKERFADGRELYLPKEGKIWVLVKRNAPIPGWKVWGGASKEREGVTLGEMEEIGMTAIVDPASPDNPLNQNPDAFSRRVFIGLGHCDGDPGKTCTDPLVQDALFVASQEGAEPPDLPECMTKWPEATSKECQKEPGYWWEFNVYYDLSKLPYNPTTDDLPCWMKMECEIETVMGDCRLWMIETDCGQNPGSPPPSGCELGDWAKAKTPPLAKILARFRVFSQGPNPPSFIRKDGIDFIKPEVRDELKDIYWSETTTNKDPTEIGAELIGKYPRDNPAFDVYYLTEGGVLVLASPASPPFHTYVPLITLVRPGAKTLQLGTFSPIKSFHYEWFTPACKPAIYLYPEKETSLSIKVIPQGKITESIPEHGEGWENVTAFPDGKIIYRQKLYPYLYYEAEIEKVKVPEKGWVVKKEELEVLFNGLLPLLGLNQKEIDDFKDYWLQALNKAPHYFVGLIDQEELEKVEPIKFSIRPDSFIRVRLFFEPLDQPVFAEAPNLPPVPNRAGFIAVDWGGILSSGTCGDPQVVR